MGTASKRNADYAAYQDYLEEETMPIHPNPEYKLFGFIIEYANGGTDHGLIVASDQETARLQLENESFCTTDVKITINQPEVVGTLLGQYRGLAYFTTEPSCN